MGGACRRAAPGLGVASSKAWAAICLLTFQVAFQVSGAHEWTLKQSGADQPPNPSGPHAGGGAPPPAVAPLPLPPCASAPLRLREFPDWSSYYKWRLSVSPLCARNRPVQPCVRVEKGWACLPKLVVIGAMKGGTTGLRAMLGSTSRFHTRRGAEGRLLEGHVWDQGLAHDKRLSNLQIAELWATKVGLVEAATWEDLAGDADNRHARRVAFEVTPDYLWSLEAADVRRMLEVNPDAHFLVLARDPADAFFSFREMSVCAWGELPGEECGRLGCDHRIYMYPRVPKYQGNRDRCRPEEIPCEGFTTKLAHFFRDGVRRLARRDHPGLGYLDGGLTMQEWEGATKDVLFSARAHFDRWRYASYIHQEWMRIVPRHQLHIFQSERLWSEPGKVLAEIARALRLGFNLTLPSQGERGLQTKPEIQTACHCPNAEENIRSLRAIVKRCRLKDAVRCAHLHANAAFSSLMKSEFGEWPASPVLGWNKDLTPAKCAELGFNTDVPHRLSMSKPASGAESGSGLASGTEFYFNTDEL